MKPNSNQGKTSSKGLNNTDLDANAGTTQRTANDTDTPSASAERADKGGWGGGNDPETVGAVQGNTDPA